MDQTSPNSNGNSGNNGTAGAPQGTDAPGVAGSQAASAAARDRLMTDLKAAVGDAETWLQETASEAGDQADDLRARFEDALHTAKSDLCKLEESLVARSREAADAANVYVRENPWQAVGLGVAVGLLIGLLTARR